MSFPDPVSSLQQSATPATLQTQAEQTTFETEPSVPTDINHPPATTQAPVIIQTKMPAPAKWSAKQPLASLEPLQHVVLPGLD